MFTFPQFYWFPRNLYNFLVYKVYFWDIYATKNHVSRDVFGWDVWPVCTELTYVHWVDLVALTSPHLVCKCLCHLGEFTTEVNVNTEVKITLKQQGKYPISFGLYEIKSAKIHGICIWSNLCMCIYIKDRTLHEVANMLVFFVGKEDFQLIINYDLKIDRYFY